MQRALLQCCLASTFFLNGSMACAQTIKGWLLEQDNPHTGTWNVYLSNAGMAAVNKKIGCTLVAKSPQWNVVMYNDLTKVYFMTPLAEWKGTSAKAQGLKAKQAYSRAQNILTEKPPRRIKDGKILGHRATEYLTDNLVSTGLKKVEYWIAPEIEVPLQLKQIFAKIYGVSVGKMQGLPLEVSYIDENGKKTPLFSTTKIAATQIPLQSFTYPSSYKRVDSEIAVLMDERGQEAMANIMDDIGDQAPGEDIDSLIGSSKKAPTAYKNSYDAYSDEKSAAADADNLLGDSKSASQQSSGNWFEDIWKTICDWFANFGK